MLAKRKYIKYKSKYLKLKALSGGTFDLNENDYTKIPSEQLYQKSIQVKNATYIAGPISLSIITTLNTIPVRKIYLFGDVHITANYFNCNQDPNNTTNENTVYLPDYLNTVLKHQKDHVIDVFIELPYQQTKIISDMEPGMINNIRHVFEPCFKLLTDKVECKKLYPNVRFHAMDIRYYCDLSEKPISDIGILCNWIKSYSNNMPTLQTRLTYRLKMNRIFLNAIIDTITLPDKLSSIANILKNVDINILYSDAYNKLEATFIKEGYEYIAKGELNDDDKAEITKILDLFYGGSKKTKEMLNIDDDFIDFFRRYISNGHDLYDDYQERFWKLVTENYKITKNLQDNTEFIKKYYSLDMLKNTWSSNMNNINYKSIDHTPCSLNCHRDLRNFIIKYGACVMDVYLLARLFKKFNARSQETYVENAIIIAGGHHIKQYYNFFINIGSEIVYHQPMTSLENIVGNPSTRCVNMVHSLETL